MRNTTMDKLFVALNYLILSIVLVVTAYPLILVLSSSLSSHTAINAGKVWLFPVDFSLEGYQAVFRYGMIVTGYANSLFYMIAGTAVNLVMTVMLAFPLSRPELPFRKGILVYFTFTMFFGGGLLPTYILIRDLNLINTRWVMIIPAALSVWNALVMRAYFTTNIHPEMLDAAHIDGCDDIRMLIKVVLPLSGPILAVMALFYGVGHWNAYFHAMLFLEERSLYPLQLVLREILVMNSVNIDMLSRDPQGFKLRLELVDVLKYAVIVVANIPLIIAYPFVQRFFVKGVMLGSLKG